MVLFVFNPDTDLSLANGVGNYTPTAPVRQMIQDLAMLPIWYADSGSYVLAEGEANQKFLEEISERFHLNVKLIPLKGLPFVEEPIDVCPWGWNRSFRNMLNRAGVSMEYLPNDFELDEQRKLSQRNVVGIVLDLFKDEPGFCGISRNVLKTSGCEKYFNIMADTGGVVFKEPWSSSGKGLLWCRDAFTEKDRNWCQRVIDTQGYVAMSPIYNKVQDFAMEFYVNEEIERYLMDYVPKDNLQKAKQMVGGFLGIYGYRACVGVDMMICEEPSGMCIHPCVEINYRATMGYFARILKDEYLTEDAQGRFMVQHFHSHEELVTFVESSKKKAPLQIHKGRIRSGFMPLVPVTPTSMNLAYIDVY